MNDLPSDKQKPHTEGLKLIRAAMITDELIYFGDTVDDMKCASAFGAYGVGVLNGNNDDNMEKTLINAGAKTVLNSINDLVEILESKNENSSNLQKD